MLKILHAGLQHYVNQEFQVSKLGLEKEEELEIKLPTFTELQRKQGNFRKTSISLSSTMLKSLTVWIMKNCGNLLEWWEYQNILPVFWETCMWMKKQQLEQCMGQPIRSILRNEYNRAVCCHPWAHHEKCWAGSVTSLNQDRQEKHQQPQICEW